VYYVFLGISVH